MKTFNGITTCPNCKEQFKLKEFKGDYLSKPIVDAPCIEYSEQTIFLREKDIVYYNSPNSYRVKFDCPECLWLVDYIHSENTEN